MDVAYGLTSLAVTKLVVYTFGTLIHLFLIVLILGNRRLRRLEWLVLGLMAALFMWYSGNLLSLNISLFYGAGPAVLSGFSRAVSMIGFMAAVPLLVNVQMEYCASRVRMQFWWRIVEACFYLPVTLFPRLLGGLLGHLGVEPLVALGPSVRLLVLWAAAALLFAVAVNTYLSVRRLAADVALAGFHGYLAGLQLFLALGWAVAYLPHALPPVGGLGAYFPAALMLAGIIPSALMGYSIFRYNFLDLRVQRNVIYSVAAIFGFLIYLNFMRRLSDWLEAHDVLPSAVTEGVMIFILVILVEPLKRLVSKALHRQFVSEFEKLQKFALEVDELAKRTGDVAALRNLVESRLPEVLDLEGAKLRLGPPSTNDRGGNWNDQTLRVPIFRGGETIAFLEVVSTSGGASGEQVAALEILADRLAAALELCRLIADKINLERELAAKEKMAFLGEMAARIAHNVKNPLSGMKTIVQLMEEDQTLPEAARRDCRMLVNEIDRLNRNISQVLRYAKPARDTDQPADLVGVIRRVAALSRLEAEQHCVTLAIDAVGPCLVEGGEEAASDIISNLLVNALQASGDGTAIHIRLAHPAGQSQYVELSVEDHGYGIPKDKQDKIFQPFFTTRAGGTGLGLAIVKRRVDEIGGFVECQSPVSEKTGTSGQTGARFIVRFRVAQTLNHAGLGIRDSELAINPGPEPQVPKR